MQYAQTKSAEPETLYKGQGARKHMGASLWSGRVPFASLLPGFTQDGFGPLGAHGNALLDNEMGILALR